MSRPVLANIPWWSSQFKRVYLTSPSLPFLTLDFEPDEIRKASRQALSRTTKSLLGAEEESMPAPFAAAPRGTWAWAGRRWGLERLGRFGLEVNVKAWARGLSDFVGSGFVGRSIVVIVKEVFLLLFVSSWSSSTSTISASSLPLLGLLCLLRNAGLSPGVDFGLGGGSTKLLLFAFRANCSAVRRSSESVVEPECRRRRGTVGLGVETWAILVVEE